RLVYVKARIVLDGGAYASTSMAVVANATTLGVGPYRVPSVTIDGYAAYTNNPPCGAMRGFGAVQACFAYESQMDRLAEALGLDQVTVATADTSVGSAGSSSASRQTYVTGGAVKAACEAVRAEVLRRAGLTDGRLAGGKLLTVDGEVVADLAGVLGDRPVEL